MTAYSQNGWVANDRSLIETITVTASGRVMALRKGPAGLMLAHAVRWFDENIRDIDPGILDEWGYAERPIRGSTTELSNHASGTAADVDATKWPLGVEPTSYLTVAEIAKFHEHLKLYEGCVRWGADYVGRKDPMHLEIDRDESTVNRVWAKIVQAEQQAPTTVPEEEDDMAWQLLRADKGKDKPADLFICGPRFAEHITEDSDTVALRKQCEEYNVSDELAQRIVRRINR